MPELSYCKKAGPDGKMCHDLWWNVSFAPGYLFCHKLKEEPWTRLKCPKEDFDPRKWIR